MTARFVSTPFVFFLLCIAFAPRLAFPAQSAAQSSPADSSPADSSLGGSNPAIIQSVDVRPQANGVTVEIDASEPFIPQALRLGGPERLVFDFPGYLLRGANRVIPVNSGPVRQVRLSLFSVHPPITRVVVDSKQPLDFQVTPAGNNVQIEIAFSGATPASASHPVSSHSVSPTPASHSTSSASHSASPASPSTSSSTAAGKEPARPSTRIAHSSSPKIAAHASLAHVSATTLQVRAKSLALKDLQPLEEKARTGDAEAETTLALAYHAGVLLKKDDLEALRLLHKAADHRFMAAEESLGIFSETGIGMAQPAPAQAMEWFGRAVQQGSLDAMTNMALMYADGIGVAKDPAQALTWFRKAAESGEGAAQYNLALIYARGEGTPQDYKESLRWLTAAADKNVLPAVMDLGAFYLRPPDGTPADVDRAIHCYEKAADLGSDHAPAILGKIFATGAQGKPDYEQAVKWYRMSADKEQRDGEYGLGIRYALGQGVAVDLQQARWLFTAAATQGLAQAQYNLATMCEEGRGAPPDPTCATQYYQLAADQGMAKAQYRLGRFLAGSKDSGSDRVSAYKWLTLAQASIKDSAPVLDDLKKSMSEQEISDADQEVDNWRVAHPDRK